jgi:hypothetical protein
MIVMLKLMRMVAKDLSRAETSYLCSGAPHAISHRDLSRLS